MIYCIKTFSSARACVFGVTCENFKEFSERSVSGAKKPESEDVVFLTSGLPKDKKKGRGKGKLAPNAEHCTLPASSIQLVCS